MNKHFTQRPYKKIKEKNNFNWFKLFFYMWLVSSMILISMEVSKNTKQIEILINETKEIRVEQQEVKEVILSEGDIREARITCYEATGNLTASGKVPKNGMVATSDRTIPFGTEIIIDGQTYIVEDRTNKRFENFSLMTVDIFWEDSLESCLDFGVQYKNIIIK